MLPTRIIRQLKCAGLKVAGVRGTIINATLFPSAARPNSKVNRVGEEPTVVSSANQEARWVKKADHAYYGYRDYSAVDTEDGYVEHMEVQPANEAEGNKPPAIVDQLPPQIDATLPDKGDACAANQQALKDRGLGDLVQHEASRGNLLHPAHTRRNKAIGAIPIKVEQGFGTMKR